MYDLPSRTDVGTVVVNEDVINGTAAPLFKPERLPRIEKKDAAKVDLKVINSKSA